MNECHSVKEDLKTAQLNILRELDRVCKENGLKYYMAYGTCLGAVRHKGYIPWDHDMDVLMPIEDAKKLVKIQSKLNRRFFVQSYKTDKEYQSIAYRLRDSETTCIERECLGLDINHGIYVDIYTFYNCPSGKAKLQYYIILSYIYRALVANRIPYNHGKIMKVATSILLFLFKGKNRVKMIDKIENKLCSVKKGNGILDYYGEDVTLMSAIVYDNEWFEEPSTLQFEGEMFWGPTDPDRYLSKRYGNYMKLPSKEIQDKPIPYLFVDSHHSYKEHKDKWIKEKKNG